MSDNPKFVAVEAKAALTLTGIDALKNVGRSITTVTIINFPRSVDQFKELQKCLTKEGHTGKTHRFCGFQSVH